MNFAPREVHRGVRDKKKKKKKQKIHQKTKTKKLSAGDLSPPNQMNLSLTMRCDATDANEQFVAKLLNHTVFEQTAPAEKENEGETKKKGRVNQKNFIFTAPKR